MASDSAFRLRAQEALAAAEAKLAPNGNFEELFKTTILKRRRRDAHSSRLLSNPRAGNAKNFAAHISSEPIEGGVRAACAPTPHRHTKRTPCCQFARVYLLDMNLKLSGTAAEAKSLEYRLLNWRDYLAPQLSDIYHYYFQGASASCQSMLSTPTDV
jgi:hypothetical protein